MILITGATGLVGAALLKRFLDAKVKVKACYRSEYRKNQLLQYLKKHNYSAAQLATIEWTLTDINALGSLDSAFENVSEVYHCAALVQLDDSKNERLLKTNAEGTANVVNYCIQKGVKKLLYVSSIAALGDPIANEKIDETTPWNNDLPKTGYAYSKYRAELEVWRGMQEGVNAIIVNPGVILGYAHRTGPAKQFFNYVQRPTYYFSSGGTGYVHVDDVVDALLQLAKSKLKNARYVLVAENLSYKTFLARLQQQNQLKSSAKFVSATTLKLLWMADTVAAFLKLKKKVFSKGLLQSLTTTATYDGTKITKALPGFQYRPLDTDLVAPKK